MIKMRCLITSCSARPQRAQQLFDQAIQIERIVIVSVGRLGTFRISNLARVMEMINSASDHVPSECPQSFAKLVGKRSLARRIHPINADANGVRAEQSCQAGS